MHMDGQLILDILLAAGGVLALVGLGGAVSLSRGSRRHDVQIIVKQEHGAAQVVTLPQDSTAVKELNKVEGINIEVKDDAADEGSPASDYKKERRLEIGGLVAGVAASVAAVVPFAVAGEIAVVIITGLGALLLTSVGVVITRLRAHFTGEEWKASTAKKRREAVRDAALLRELPRPD
jgi:hypothetical protein